MLLVEVLSMPPMGMGSEGPRRWGIEYGNVDSLLEWYKAEVIGPESPFDLLNSVPRGGYKGAD